MGRSGSGKSTLLCMLGGIDWPTSGEVLLESVNLATLSDDQRTITRRRRIGFIFQAFNLLPILSAEENVSLPLEFDGVTAAEARRRARGSPGDGPHGRPPHPHSQHALRRRAAAGGDRPGPGDQAGHPPGRRAHRQLGQRQRSSG